MTSSPDNSTPQGSSSSARGKSFDALQQRFHASQVRFRTLFNSLALGVLYHRDDGTIADANLAAEQILKRSHRSLMGQTLAGLFKCVTRPDNCPTTGDQCPVVRALQTRAPVRNLVLKCTFADHTERYIRFTAIPKSVPEVSGSAQVCTLLEDVTEMRHLLALLEKNDRQMRLAECVAGIGRWEWDIQKGTHAASDEMYRLMGLTRDWSATTANFLDRLYPADRPRMETALARTVRDGVSINEKVRVVWPDQTVHWLHTQGEVVHFDGEYPAVMVGIARDITQEHRLLADRENFSQVLAHTHEGIFQSTPSGQLVQANPALVRMFGYATADEMVANLTDLRNQVYVNPVRGDQLRELLRETDQISDFEAQMRRKDGTTLWASIHARALRDEHGVAVALEGFLEDISARKTLEAERARRQRETLYLADHDPLTGLLNHGAFQKRLKASVAHARRTDTRLGLALLDIDNFTVFNSTFGHATGDSVLRLVAQRLREIGHAGDVYARYGGDEFALLFPDLGEASKVETLERRLASALGGLSYPLPDSDTHVPLTVSAGVALLQPFDTSARDLLTRAQERLQTLRTSGEAETAATRLRHALLSDIEGFPMLDALVTAIDNKDRYTRHHSEDVMTHALHLADALGLDAETRHTVAVAALIHDVGKIGVPDAILRKPSALTDDEFAAIRQHPQLGALIVAAVPGLEATLDAVRHHHERWDGHGYPHGLAANAIPFLARLIAIADSYSAMTSDRPYRAGLSPDLARARLRTGAGTQWDPLLTHAFLTALPAA